MEAKGFVYTRLAPLSTTTSSSSSLGSVSPDPYTVFRTEVPSSTLTCPSPSTAAPDYFSLDVEDGDIDSKQSAASATPPAADPASESNRTLERGWFRANGRFKSPMLQLHKEILDFCDFLSPTPEEQISRNEAVEGVFGVVKYIWPHCKVEVFGSFKTGLYLPTSDIDVVILDSKVKTPQMGLIALSRALSQKGIAKKIQVIAKARVPIIKFIEKRSGVSFDICFDVPSGSKAAVFIKDAISKTPPLRPLCLILKVFLQQRELNEVYSGGIGSYALITMLIAHLQLHWKGQYFQECKASLEQNLGILLISFFEFYGRKLNIWDVGVSCKASGTFFLKNKKGLLNGERPYRLSIEDPQAPENDIGKNSFNYSQIKSAFGMAFSTLTNPKTILSLGSNRSILGTIIRPDSILLERKGGVSGEMTLESLLRGAGEPFQLQLYDEQEVVGNWQFVEEEPFPRESVIFEEDKSHSSKKRKKFLNEKRISLATVVDGEVIQNNGVESKSRKEKFLKKSQKSHKNAGGDDEHEVIGNWQFDEEEPFPRDNLIFEEDNAHSSKKRNKLLKGKQTSLATGDGEVIQINLVESKPKEEKDLKKHHKSHKNARGDGEVLQTNVKGSKPRKEKGLKKGRKGHKNVGAGF